MQKDKKIFYWNEDTVDYYVRHEETNGWPSTATRILEFVTNECDLEEDETVIDLFRSLSEAVYNKINYAE